MHKIGMFDRKGALSLEGFEGSGADWLERYKPLINDGQTIISNPHKVYGPETNDLVLQLRKRGIDKVILGGMSANLCTEPLAAFISPEGVKWQYTHGVRNAQLISPDNWNVDLRHLQRDGNPAIQLALFYDYQNNVPHYPAWQAYFREYQPPTLVVWGKNDYIFPAEGAYPYQRDLKNIEFHLLDTGHFALEEDGQLIARLIRSFHQNEVKTIGQSGLSAGR